MTNHRPLCKNCDSVKNINDMVEPYENKIAGENKFLIGAYNSLVQYGTEITIQLHTIHSDKRKNDNIVIVLKNDYRAEATVEFDGRKLIVKLHDRTLQFPPNLTKEDVEFIEKNLHYFKAVNNIASKVQP